MAKFRKKPVVVDAIRVTKPITVQIDGGKMKGAVGSWMITEGGGVYFLTDAAFREAHEPVEDLAKELLEDQHDQPQAFDN